VAGALREILRVVKPGGRLAFLVWADRELNPFFTVITEVLNHFVAAEPEDEDAPTAFRFARPGKLATLLKQAGAQAVKERALKFDTEAAVDISEFWNFRTEMSDTFRTKLAKLSPDEVSGARDAVHKAAAIYFENGSMRFPSEVLIVSGRKAVKSKSC